MKKLILLLAIIATSISCSQQPKVKEELKVILEKYAGNLQRPYIDVENSNIHDGKQEQHLLINYNLEDAGVELEIAQNNIGGLSGLISASDENKFFIAYSSIQNIYTQSKWNEFDPKREKIIIVLNK
jgi:hypothetical protein